MVHLPSTKAALPAHPPSQETRSAVYAGTRLGRYHVLRLLGQGGMGAVYEAYDPELSRKLAIKVLCSKVGEGSEAARATERARLLREAKNLAKLSHPNIVPIFDVGQLADGSVYLAMEFVIGQTLKEVLRRRDLRWRPLLELVLQAGEGLAAAHSVGLLHRDFKPDNIIVGTDKLVRVLDFGLSLDATQSGLHASEGDNSDHVRALRDGSESLILDPDSLASQAAAGTPSYMAPEQVSGVGLGPPCDVFAFCCVVFEAICHARPFPNNSFASRHQAILRRKLTWPREIPMWLRAALAQGLSFDPQARGAGLPALLHEIRRGLARDRRRQNSARWVLGLTLPVLAATLTWMRPDPPADPECRDPGRAVDEVWNGSAQVHLDESFAHTNLALASEVVDQVSTGLDDWKARWTSSAARRCEVHGLGQSASPTTSMFNEQSRGCLAESRAEVVALLAVWNQPTLQQVLAAASSVAALSRPEACVDGKALLSRAPLPVDPQRRQRALAQLAAIKGARVRTEQADFDGARAALQEIRASASFDLEAMVEAEHAYAFGELAYIASNYGVASTLGLQKALLWAIAAKRPVLAGKAATDLWFARVYSGNVRDESEDRLSEQESIIRRSNHSDELLAGFNRSRAIWAGMRGHHEVAMDHFINSLKYTRQAFGEHAVKTAWAVDDVGYTALLLGNFEQGEFYYRKVLAIRQKIQPESHPDRTRTRITLADILENTGHVAASIFEVLDGWHTCLATGVPEIVCLDYQRGFVRKVAAVGNPLLALNDALSVLNLEHQIARRVDFTAPWAEESVGSLLAARGELLPATDLVHLSLAKLRAETHVHPSAFVLTHLRAANLALYRSDVDQARVHLDETANLLRTPTEEGRAYHAMLTQTRGLLGLAIRDPQAAALAFEQARLEWHDARPSPYRLAFLQLHLANALADLRDFDLALHHAREGLALLQATDGISSLLLVPFHETIAGVALLQQRYGDALAELELAHVAFDAAQILDNRRAALYFLEAQAWALLDPSAAGYTQARALAQVALRHYQSWDTGAGSAVGEIKVWLRSLATSQRIRQQVAIFWTPSNSLSRIATMLTPHH